MKNNCVILELIPSASTPAVGEVIQLSAIKVNDERVVGRFDYRINPNKIKIAGVSEMFSYDESEFTYKETTAEIMSDFAKFASDNSLYVMANDYTEKYLKHYDLNNEQISIFDVLNMEYRDSVIEDMFEKFNIQPTNYIVDALFEALIFNMQKPHTK